MRLKYILSFVIEGFGIDKEKCHCVLQSDTNGAATSIQPMFLIGSTEPCKFWSWRNMCILGVCTPTLIVAPRGWDF